MYGGNKVTVKTEKSRNSLHSRGNKPWIPGRGHRPILYLVPKYKLHFPGISLRQQITKSDVI